MNKVVEFKLKDKKPNQVYEHECGAQLWFLEFLPAGKSKDGGVFESLVVARCFGCGEYIQLDGLLSNDEDDE